jgi:hypothetical protein
VCEASTIHILLPPFLDLKPFYRCTSALRDPNSNGVRRCREHTEALVEQLELGVLWDEYGLVGDVVVDIMSLSPELS